VRSPGDHKKGTHVGHHVLREARADEKRLLALPDAVALSLFRSGELHLISLHLASLANEETGGPDGRAQNAASAGPETAVG
jgi:hypothetical protein